MKLEQEKAQSITKKDMMDNYNNIFNKVKHDLGNGLTYNDQIEKYCNKTALSKHNFLGVFAQDVNPNMIDSHDNCCLIINTSKSHEPGEHWISIWKESNPTPKIYYFDSFGRNPEKLVPLFNGRLGGNIIYDDDKNQKDNEENCGQRSISWLLSCCKYGIKNAIKI